MKGAALIESDAGSLFFFWGGGVSCRGKGMRGLGVCVFLCSNGLLHIFIIRESLKRGRQHKIPNITELLLPVDAWLKGLFIFVHR